MYIFKVHGKEYMVRFTNRMLCEGDILDKVTNTFTDEDLATPKSIISKMIRTTAELLLVGLQKYHSKEFGYKSDETKQERIEQVIDLLDDYEDESTDDHPQSAFTLYTDLQEELGKIGFLSAILNWGERATEMTEAMTSVTQEMEEKPVIDKVTNLNTPPSEKE